MQQLKRVLLYLAGQIGFSYAAHFIFKKLPAALTENAVMGWIDDQIAFALGLSSPEASTVVSWAIPILLVAVMLWAYHTAHTKWVLPPDSANRLPTVWRKELLLPLLIFSTCFLGAGISGIWLYRAAIQSTPGGTETRSRSTAQDKTPTTKTGPLESQTSTPKDENLIGSATLLFNVDDNTLTVLKYEGIRSVAVEPIANITVIPTSYVVTFIFYPHQGPFDVRIDGDFGTYGQPLGLLYSVSQNEDRFVSVNVTRGFTLPRTHQTGFRFYRRK